MGNFLWGAATYIMGVPQFLALSGAHVNNLVIDNWTLDSPDDQYAIKLGRYYAKKMGWKTSCAEKIIFSILRILILLVLSFLVISCYNTNKNEILVRKTIHNFENYEKLYPNNCWIRILRSSSKRPEYEMRSRDKKGYAIFGTFPDELILKNFTSDSISDEFVKHFADLNDNNSVVVQLFEKHFDQIRIDIKIDNKVISLYRNQEDSSTSDSLLVYNNWVYSIRDFIPER